MNKSLFGLIFIVLLLFFSLFSCQPNLPPEKPQPISPTNGATEIQTEKLELVWQAKDPNNNPITFDLYFGTSPDNLQILSKNSKINTFVVEKLKGHTKYYWKVVVKDDKGAITEGDVWSFTTKNNPPQISIADTQIKEGERLEIDLKEFSYDKDDDPLKYEVISGPGKIEGSKYVYDAGYEDSGEHKVKIKVSDGFSENFSTFTVKVIDVNRPPTVPKALNPKDKQDNVNLRIELKWESQDLDGDEVTHTLFFGKNLENKVDNLKKSEYKISNLSPHTVYKWKVIAKDSKGAFSESPIFVFKTLNHVPTKPKIHYPKSGYYGLLPNFVFSWESYDLDDDQLKYDIYVKERGKAWKKYLSNLENNKVSIILDFNKAYKLKVVAKDGYGGISESDEIEVITKDFWQVKLGDSKTFEKGTSIIQTDDSYLISGYTFTDEGKVRILLIKTDLKGNLIWRKVFDSEGEGIVYRLVNSHDGNVIAVGYVENEKNNKEIYIAKINQEGKIIWKKTFGGWKNEKAYSVIESEKNKMILIVGYTDSYGAGGKDIIIVGLDYHGNMIFTRVYGEKNTDDVAYDIDVDKNGDFVVTGYRKDIKTNISYPFVMKINKTGDQIWVRNIKERNTDAQFRSVMVTEDGNYLLTGFYKLIKSQAKDIYVLKMSNSGKLLWKRTFGITLREDIGYQSVESNGVYYVVGYSNSYSYGNTDAIILALDKSGKLLWERNFGTEGREEAYSISVRDDELAIVGSTFSGDYSNIFLMKMHISNTFSWEKIYGWAREEVVKNAYLTSNNIVAVGYTTSVTGKRDKPLPLILNYSYDGDALGIKYISFNFPVVLNDVVVDGDYRIVVGWQMKDNVKKIFVIKFNKSGKIMWTRTLGDKTETVANKVLNLGDGYVLVGYITVKSGGKFNKDIYIVKLSKKGKVLWQKTIGGWKDDIATSAVSLKDDYFVVVGYTKSYSSNQDVIIIKIDKNGEVKWMNLYGTKFTDEAYDVIEDVKGNIVIVGSTYNKENGKDVYILELDKYGYKIKENIWGMKGNEIAYGISEVKNGNYVVVGYEETIYKDKDGLLLMINKNLEPVKIKRFGGLKDEIFYKVKSSIKGTVIVGYTDSYVIGQHDGFIAFIDSDEFRKEKRIEKKTKPIKPKSKEIGEGVYDK